MRRKEQQHWLQAPLSETSWGGKNNSIDYKPHCHRRHEEERTTALPTSPTVIDVMRRKEQQHWLQAPLSETSWGGKNNSTAYKPHCQRRHEEERTTALPTSPTVRDVIRRKEQQHWLQAPLSETSLGGKNNSIDYKPHCQRRHEEERTTVLTTSPTVRDVMRRRKEQQHWLQAPLSETSWGGKNYSIDYKPHCQRRRTIATAYRQHQMTTSSTCWQMHMVWHKSFLVFAPVQQVSWSFTPSQPVRLYQGDTHLILYI